MARRLIVDGKMCDLPSDSDSFSRQVIFPYLRAVWHFQLTMLLVLIPFRPVLCAYTSIYAVPCLHTSQGQLISWLFSFEAVDLISRQRIDCNFWVSDFPFHSNCSTSLTQNNMFLHYLFSHWFSSHRQCSFLSYAGITVTTSVALSSLMFFTHTHTHVSYSLYFSSSLFRSLSFHHYSCLQFTHSFISLSPIVHLPRSLILVGV